jgi:hypothetical protein
MPTVPNFPGGVWGLVPGAVAITVRLLEDRFGMQRSATSGFNVVNEFNRECSD